MTHHFAFGDAGPVCTVRPFIDPTSKTEEEQTQRNIEDIEKLYGAFGDEVGSIIKKCVTHFTENLEELDASMKLTSAQVNEVCLCPGRKAEIVFTAAVEKVLIS